MGRTLEGILAYGFDLGGADSKWSITGVQEYEEWRPSWATPEQLEEIEAGTLDYSSAISDRLEAAELDLDVVEYGMLEHEESTGLMVTAFCSTSEGGSTSALTLQDLLDRREIERWDEAFVKALKVLDIRPWQPHPMWLLTQSYG